MPFFDIASVMAGKESPVLQRGLAQWADADCCFSLALNDSAGGGTLDFEVCAQIRFVCVWGGGGLMKPS